EEFINYGWRFAFFAVMAVNVVSLFARIRLLSADFGSDGRLITTAPFFKMVQTQWKPIRLSTLTPLGSYALFHMVTVFPLGYEILYSDRNIADIMLLELVGGVLAIGSVILSGIAADKFSRYRVAWISSAMITLLCLSINTLDTMPAVYILFGFVLLGFAHGQSGAISSGRFPIEYRYSASALATNLAWIVGAAFAPLSGLWLTSKFGLWAAALYMLSGAVVTSFALTFNKRHEQEYGEA
ncbi:MAG: MFS transporter, partial [Pseudomonadota bacterium]